MTLSPLSDSPDFRWHLREATAADHARLDAAVSRFDVATRDGLAGFAITHLAAFRAMQSVAERADLRAMIDALTRDLLSLGAAGEVPTLTAPATDPLAVDYILAGSRMGTKVLRRQWASATDAGVRAASAYFGLPVDPAEWPSVRLALSQVDAGSDRAARIVADVGALYGLFEEATDVVQGARRTAA